MITIQSSLLDVLRDIPRCILEDEVAFGYIICDRVAIWDPTWINPKEEALPAIRFNEDYIEKTGILTLSMPLTGGTIVNNIGDIGILVVSNDMHSTWEKDAMNYLADYLLYEYDIVATIQGNDMLINDKKFLGSSIGFLNGNRLAALFISMNDNTDWLIKKICIKPNKHKGFVGLNKYDVCPTKLIKRLRDFTRKWGAKYDRKKIETVRTDV